MRHRPRASSDRIRCDARVGGLAREGLHFSLRLRQALPPCPPTKATQTDLRLPPTQDLCHLARHVGSLLDTLRALGSVRLAPQGLVKGCD